MKVSGTVGWIGLVAYVVAWDYLMDDALSTAFARSIRHPIKRWPVTLAWGLTTLHLFEKMPHHMDPFGGFGHLVRKRHIRALSSG